MFSDLETILRPGDTLVFNDSRVLPARVQARKVSGGAVELLFLHRSDQRDEDGAECWEVLARPSHRLRPGGELTLADGERLTLVRLLGEGRWVVTGTSGRPMVAVMEANGRLPIPPYIKTYPLVPSSYQTVYAAVPGSAAAPTAGLHFTPELMTRLADMGVNSAYVTLHVGLDTFLPIREEVVEEPSSSTPRHGASAPRPCVQSGRRSRRHAPGGGWYDRCPGARDSRRRRRRRAPVLDERGQAGPPVSSSRRDTAFTWWTRC